MILDDIVRDKKVRLIEHKKNRSFEEVRAAAERIVSATDDARNADLFYQNMKKSGISIIGEFKKASPSLGKIEEKIDLLERIDEYNACVDAISCLTEEDHFQGNVGYLMTIREKTTLPILRKDFMIDEYQFYEAKAIGADAVLLITAILDDAQMKDFYQLSRELKLGVLVETHDEYEIERALKIDPRVIGINNRNLKDFSISLENTGKLRKYIPKDKLLIAESGIMGDEDVRYLKEVGVDGFLIGRAFMESDEPAKLAARWKCDS
ncbi:MAG: indole-3-glycerol phosphate synthase TrpC [Lachnospiraceae bacterium]|nr:indole-3-glycerol phosphate synthase TrpC [Lachnospiraceae bacterium]